MKLTLKRKIWLIVFAVLLVLGTFVVLWNQYNDQNTINKLQHKAPVVKTIHDTVTSIVTVPNSTPIIIDHQVITKNPDGSTTTSAGKPTVVTTSTSTTQRPTTTTTKLPTTTTTIPCTINLLDKCLVK